jgi:hypothetical protein
MEAGGAGSPDIERAPLVAEGAEPLVSLRGDQPDSGQRMGGVSDVPGFCSCSRSRSGTTTGLSATELVLAILTYAPII